jgi:hypothetical protein
MILYVNGDSHSAAAEAVNNYAFAEDDTAHWQLGRRPHPDNLAVSYGQHLANQLNATLHCDAESASSNSRIERTTKNYLRDYGKPDLILIGWSTWEREEWWDHEAQRYWQVNAGGIGHDWPEFIKSKYKDYIRRVDYQSCVSKWHHKVHEFHLHLENRGVPHLFFNTFSPFNNVLQYTDWGTSYIDPYNPNLTYINWLKLQGFDTVNPNSYHFGADAHQAWAEFLIQTIILQGLTQ